MKSIVQKEGEERKCFLCGRTTFLEEHHILGGTNRKNSEKYGLKVDLCHFCHNEPPKGAHHNEMTANHLHRVGQIAFERVHGSREDFMKIFGRNYIKD